MPLINLTQQFVTTDGTVFTDRRLAGKHQARLNAIGEFAAGLAEKFELDPVVAANVTVFLAERPETLMQLIGKTMRKTKSDDGATDPVDASSDTEATPAE